MKVILDGGGEIDLGTVEAQPTISITDYSRRETDDYGVTTVVERGFARRMSVRLAVPFDQVDAIQRQLAELRATPAQWVADEDTDWLNVEGFYKDFELDLAIPPVSYCTLTIEGLAETEAGADDGSDPAPAGSVSTLRLLQPVTVAGAVLTASSVAETDYAEWLVGTTYALGARVIKAAQHRIYESTIAGNVGHDPAAATGQWLDVGPTNRWAMFDQALGTVTTAPAVVGVVLDSSDINAVALLDVAADTVRVEAAGYDETLPVGEGAVLFLDLPETDGPITVTVNGTGDVEIGTLLIGKLVSLGVTEQSPTAGISDFSRKETDEFGEVTVVPRAWAKRMTARALLRSDAVDQVANRLAAVRARPSLWIADEGTDSLTVYGFFKDFSIEVGETVSSLALSIEGLSQASARGALIGAVNWPDVIDSDPDDHPKPEDGATVGAPPGTPVGDRPAEDVITDLDAAGSAIAAAQSDITALEALGASLGDQADMLADSIDGLFDDVIALGTDVATIESTIATHGSQIATQGTAITGLAGSLATLSTKVSAGSRNLLPNSGFEDGLTDWNSSGGWFVSVGTVWGNMAFSGFLSGAASYLYSDPFPAAAGLDFTFSADMAHLPASGTTVFQFYVEWLDNTGTLISSNSVYKPAGVTFSQNQDGRMRFTVNAPAGAVAAQVGFAANATLGSGEFYVRQVKVEMASYMSSFTQEASVIQTFTALSGLGTQYASLSSTVATQGSSISANATAITNLNTNVATLTTVVSAGAINLLPNSTFENGFEDWYVPYPTGWSLAPPMSSPFGSYAVKAGVTADDYIGFLDIPVSPGYAYTLSGDLYFDASAGTGDYYLLIQWFNGPTFISAASGGNKSPGQGFTDNLDGRNRITATAPAGSTNARVFFYAHPTSGSLTIGVRQAKFEQGSSMSRWTQEASVFQQAQAISTAEGQIATLETEVAVQGSSITANATAIASTNSNLATLTTTVSTLGSTVSTQSTALATTNSNLASLTATVSAQGASITSTAAAVSDLTGDFATLSSNVATLGSSVSIQATAIAGINSQLSARYGIVVEAGTGIAKMTAMASGGTSSWKFESDEFEVDSPGGIAGKFRIVGNVISGYYPSGQIGYRIGPT